jgi:hypothetical protein
MQRIPVQSSQIQEIGYDPEKSVLEVQFKRGLTVYHYAGVPPEVYEDLMHSESIGKFFNANVRDKFAYTKLTQQETPESVKEISKLIGGDRASSEAQADATAPKDSQAQADATETDDGSRAS